MLAGCASDPEPQEPAPVKTTEAAPTIEPEPAATDDGPSREGLIKALADWWGEADEQDRVEVCDAIDETSGGGMWEAFGSPESISETEVDFIMADYCRDLLQPQH